MIGFCKCDICGKVYHQDENKNYDGIMIGILIKRLALLCMETESMILLNRMEKQ